MLERLDAFLPRVIEMKVTKKYSTLAPSDSDFDSDMPSAGCRCRPPHCIQATHRSPSRARQSPAPPESGPSRAAPNMRSERPAGEDAGNIFGKDQPLVVLKKLIRNSISGFEDHCRLYSSKFIIEET